MGSDSVAIAQSCRFVADRCDGLNDNRGVATDRLGVASRAGRMAIVELDQRAEDCSLRSLYSIRWRANSGVGWHTVLL